MRALRRWIPVAYPAALVVLTAVQVVAPQRNGPLALAQVFAPWLFVPLFALVPHAVLLRDRALIAALTASALVFAIHLGPDFVPAGRSTPDARAVPVTVASWNVLFRNRADRVVRGVRDLDVDVVGLVELTPAQATAVDADPAVRARFGSRVLLPEYGRGLLSRLPVLASGIRADPQLGRGSRMLWARLDLGAAGALTVLVAHPLAPRTRWLGPVPASYDTAPRDAQIAFIRTVVDDAVRAGDRVVLLGDFNVTDREPGAAVLVRGLRDAQADLGWGSGASWGLPALRRRGIALVRIDRALGGPGVVPTAVRTDCTWRGSDHCVLRASFAVTARVSPPL